MNRMQNAGRLPYVLPNPANVRIASPVAQSVTFTGPVEDPINQESFVVDRPEAIKVGDAYEVQQVGEVLTVTAVDLATGRITVARDAWQTAKVPIFPTSLMVPLRLADVGDDNVLHLRFEQPMVCSGAPCDWWIRYRDAATNQLVRIPVSPVLAADGRGAQVTIAEVVQQASKAWFGIPEHSPYLRSRFGGSLEPMNIGILAVP